MLPELARHFHGVDTGRLPPCALVAGAMDRAVMGTAQRDGEFVAGPSAERPRLGVPKMMRVRWLAAAYEAGLSSDKAQVFAVTIAPWRGDHEDTLVDTSGLVTSNPGSLRRILRRHLCHRGALSRGNVACNGRWKAGQFLLERVLEEFGIARNEAVFGGERASRPRDSRIG